MTKEDVKLFNEKNKNRMYGGYTDNPITIQEKLRWLNINEIPWDDKRNMPLKSVCSDKLLVKEYVKEILGEDISVPTIKVYDKVSQINKNDLPQKFIIKVNHNSGGTLICRNKDNFNLQDAFNKINYWMSDDFTFRNGFESHYHWISRKIFIEELLSDNNQTESLFDYKFWCFNGEPKLYTINNGHGHGDIMYYNMDDTENNLYGVKNHEEYKKPLNFNLMVEYSKKLAAPFNFVRIDFYEVNNKIYLGEMTFVPGAAMFHYKNKEDDVKIGNLLSLPINNSIKKDNIASANKPMKNILIVHFNTPELTSALIKSINLTTKDCNIYIFDNSDKRPFVNTFDNVTVFDNTKCQIIPFDETINRHPGSKSSKGRHSNYGSLKHCMAVEKCMDLINDNFLLMDSDTLAKKDLSCLFNDNYMCVGEIKPWSWTGKIKGHDYPVHNRILPFLTFINVKKCKERNIHYFNENYMDGLYSSELNNSSDEDIDRDSYDTGCWFYSVLKKDDILEIKVNDYVEHFGGASYQERNLHTNLTKEDFLRINKNLYTKMRNTKVIYTCLTGGYEGLIEPKYVTEGWDYICFTDNTTIKSDKWTIKPLPKETVGLNDVRKNRYVKVNPHRIHELDQYDCSIYVDSSVEILGDLNNLIAEYQCDNDICIQKHPLYSCIYREKDAVIKGGMDSDETVNKQIEKYKSEGFPRNYGLTHNNIIFRRHHSENCIRIMDMWWNEITNGSHRDQLSFMYCVYKNNGIGFKKLNRSMSSSKYFTWHSHKTRVENKKKNAITCHIYYPNIWRDNIEPKLTKFDLSYYDLYISISDVIEEKEQLKDEILSKYPNANIVFVPNVGEDVRGFLECVRMMEQSGVYYNYVLKIHTKSEGDWREGLLKCLIPDNMEQLNELFNKNVSFISSKGYYKTYNTPITFNRNYLTKLRELTKCEEFTTNHFSGTMFWVRWDVIKSYFIDGDLNPEYFDDKYARGGTKAHSFELLIGCIMKDCALSIGLINDSGEIEINNDYLNTEKKVVKIDNNYPLQTTNKTEQPINMPASISIVHKKQTPMPLQRSMIPNTNIIRRSHYKGTSGNKILLSKFMGW